MIVLAKELNIQMTVEGIETEEQFEFFRGMDFIALQGFLFSPALPQGALQDLKLFHPRQLPSDTEELDPEISRSA